MTSAERPAPAASSTSDGWRLAAPIARLARGARALHEDEGGASMVFAAITLFSLALSTVMIFQVGMMSSERLQTQTAADAAAYSGAVVEANALNAIGQLNDGMSYVHYTLLRYTVDQIVYGTLHGFVTHPAQVRRESSWLFSQQVMGMGMAPPGHPSEQGGTIENRAAPAFVMLGDAQEWNKRIKRVQEVGGLQEQVLDGQSGAKLLRRQGEGYIDECKTWLQDLHAAERAILEAVPALVRDAAAEVAAKNGATHVAVSSDLEKSFTVRGQGAGFSENDGGSEPRDGVAAESMVNRYAKRRMEVDGAQSHEFPRWFDRYTGKASSDYSQVRLCWNRNDWAHRSQNEVHLDFPQYMEAPNGHWHAAHTHHWLEYPGGVPTPMQQAHGGIQSPGQEKMTGGGSGGGHQMPTDDDPQLHMKAMQGQIDPFLPYDPHHAEIVCPTCQARSFGGGRFTEVRKSQGDVKKMGGAQTFELKFEGEFPRPLALKEAALRSGVTVVAWRRGSGVGDILPASEWGIVGVATAQVGITDQDGRVLALSQVTADQATFAQGKTLRLRDDPDYKNLSFSTDEKRGVRFGARLVPIARELSHHPDLWGREAVAELFDGGRWVVARSGEQGEMPAELRELRKWVVVDNPQALQEALWH